MLGLLLEGARRLQVDAKARQRWKILGDKELAARAAHAAAPATQAGQESVVLPMTAGRVAGAADSTDVDGTAHGSGEDATEER